MPLVTLVAPCFNEEAVVRDFYAEVNAVTKALPDVDFELLFVDDGSEDDTPRIMRELRADDDRIRVISFSRNFGKEAALTAGLRIASGEYVGVLDSDLQHPPRLILDMFTALEQEGYDCAAAVREDRDSGGLLRRGFAQLHYRLFNALSDTKIVPGERDFRLMSRQMVDAVNSLAEYNRFSKGMFGWVGFKTKLIPYESTQRVAGKTKWSFRRLVRYSLDGISSFSAVPLRLASVLGFLFCILSLLYGGFIVVDTVFHGADTPGWPTIAALILFLGGIQLLCIGILGEYLARTYMETKNRPLYVIKEFLE